jgi:hypothetical protein
MYLEIPPPPKCGKYCYVDEEQAKHGMEYIRQKTKNDNLDMYIYFCEACNAHHITKMSRKIYRVVKRSIKFKDKIKIHLEKQYWGKKFKINFDE